MIKKFILLTLTGFTIALNAESPSDFVTYEWLTEQAEQTAYTDHIPHWRRLFNSTKVRGFIECGCGFSTRYFIDNADKVISIEYVNPGYGEKWYQDCLRLYADRSNWIPILYNADFRSNSFNNACAYQCSEHRDYALIDATYMKELYKHFKDLIAQGKAGGYDIDVAFVDPGVYLRGDMVKLLLSHQVPIVAAHDTTSDNGPEEETNLYGWNKIVTPANYVKIYIPFRQGTTFWIHEQLPDVIAAMQKYRDGIVLLQDLGIKVTFDHLTTLADQ
jgi:hypothetical protein